MRNCLTCKRHLDNPIDPFSRDCGGDCLVCMAQAGDPECIKSIVDIVAMQPRTIEPIEPIDMFTLLAKAEDGSISIGDSRWKLWWRAYDKGPYWWNILSDITEDELTKIKTEFKEKFRGE